MLAPAMNCLSQHAIAIKLKVVCSRLRDPIELSGLGRDALNELSLALGVSYSVGCMITCQLHLQSLVFDRDVWVFNQVIAKEQSIPVL